MSGSDYKEGTERHPDWDDDDLDVAGKQRQAPRICGVFAVLLMSGLGWGFFSMLGRYWHEIMP